MKNEIDLSIITVTYQSREHIEACIMSVVASAIKINHEHFIVDNHSTDGTVELIEESYSTYVTLLKNDKNLGFAAANNRAAKLAKGRYLLFLNPDMSIQAGSLDSLVEWMDARSDVGLASCRLIASNPQFNSFLWPKQFSKSGFYIFHLLNLAPVKEIFPNYSNFDEFREQEIDHARGAFFLLRKEIVDKLGFAFDPAYFLSHEDVDLCQEVKRLGYKVIYTPIVTVMDYWGRSFAQTSDPWKFLVGSKGLKTYICKWHSPLHALWFYPAFVIGFIVRIPSWGLKASLKVLKD